MKKRIFAAACAGLCWVAVHAQDSLPYQNPSLSPSERAEDLLHRLTLKEKVSLMKNGSAAVERLGIPAYDWWNEALHGVGRAGLATVFPQTIGMAATFDDESVYETFNIISTEARAKHTSPSGHRINYKGIKVLHFGRPTSIFSAIPVGDAVRRPTEKTLTSPDVWV